MCSIRMPLLPVLIRCTPRLVNLYSKWLDEDSSELELSQEQLAELKDQLKDVTEKVKAKTGSLGSKDESLVEKEQRLEVRLQQLPCCPLRLTLHTGVSVQDSTEAEFHRPDGCHD